MRNQCCVGRIILSSDFCSVCFGCKPALGPGGRAEGLNEQLFSKSSQNSSCKKNVATFPDEEFDAVS